MNGTSLMWLNILPAGHPPREANGLGRLRVAGGKVGKMAQIVGIRTVFEGWTKVSVASVRGPDGNIFERIVEDHGSAVCVLPYDPTRKTAILVRQFRAPVCVMSAQAELLEAIAGLTEGEDPEAAGAREAFEEAGLRLSSLDYVSTTWTMPGVSTERMSLYLARYTPSDRKGRGGGLANENENITVVELSLADLAMIADAGTLDDLKTLTLVQTLRLREPGLFT
jgi:nudix-type nucleoside diphosphatase (YffH/AdpP family)